MRNLPAIPTHGSAPYLILRLFNDVGFTDHTDFTNQGTLTNSGFSTSISLVMTGDKWRGIFENLPLMKRKVQILQAFRKYDGTNLFDPVLIFQGLINSPITWDEATQSLAITVLNTIESNEVGFSLEESQVQLYSQSMIGKAWPQIFGNVVESPCLQLNSVPSTLLRESTNLRNSNQINSTNRNVRNALDSIFEQQQALLDKINSLAREIIETESLRSRVGVLSGTSSEQYITLSDRINELDELHRQALNEEIEYGRSEQYIRAFIRNPGEPGEEDNVSQRSKGSLKLYTNNIIPTDVPVSFLIESYRHSGVIRESNGEYIFVVTNKEVPNLPGFVGPVSVSDTNTYTQYNQLQGVPVVQFVQAGARIALTSLIVRYVASLEFVAVGAVLADYTVNGVTKRQVVPSAYYTVSAERFGLLNVTMITFPRPLSSYGSNDNSSGGWSDEIFFTGFNPQGGNVVTILRYLIGTYTKFGVDEASFNFTHAQVNAFPAGFTLTDRPDIIQLLQDIAFQSNCTLYLVDDTFRIKYNPVKYDPVITVSKDNVLQGSLNIGTVDTESLVTKYEASWGVKSGDDYKVIYRINKSRYGTQVRSDRYYIFNNLGNVKSKAMYWAIYYSQPFKIVNVSLPMTFLKLEVYDSVEVNLDSVSNVPITGVVQSLSYNIQENTISCSIWVPVRQGEMNEYRFAYPGNIDYIFTDDSDNGDGGDRNRSVRGDVVRQNYGSSSGRMVRANFEDRPRIMKDKDRSLPEATSSLESLLPSEAPAQDDNSLDQFVVKPANLDKFDSTKLLLTSATFIGVVKSKEDKNEYFVNAYINGIDRLPVGLKMAFPFVKGDIPEDMTCIVIREVVKEGNVQFNKYVGYIPTFGKLKDEDV